MSVSVPLGARGTGRELAGEKEMAQLGRDSRRESATFPRGLPTRAARRPGLFGEFALGCLERGLARVDSPARRLEQGTAKGVDELEHQRDPALLVKGDDVAALSSGSTTP
ncbi:MAG: hypothetical protein KatS3mg061_2074 [Dehalococcoidia bacterium]|nr:MAG: hypothetical protein KatS3mg061_2074 [Dehalococcoidia bacterium]